MAQVNAGKVRFVSRGEYNNSTQYYLFDLVDYNGSSYFAKANTTGNVPTNTTYWQLVAEKGNTGGDGPVGPTGNGIASIVKTASAGLIDTYTITFTNGSTTTFNVTNGADGEVTQEYVDEENERLKSVFNVLPKVSDSGESVTLENTGDTMLYKMDLKGNTSQEVIQGEVGLEEEDTSIYVDDVNEDKENYITLKGNTYQESTSISGGDQYDSPNPDYPQEIEVVTGENEVVVNGKNLFDKDNFNIIHKHPNGTSIETNHNFVTTYFEAKEGETYTMSSNSSLFDTWACIFFTATDPTTATTILSNTTRSGTSVNYVSATAPTGTKYACFYMMFSTNQTNINSLLETIQLEKGSTATTYEAYKGQTYPINLGRYFPAGYTQVDYIESTGTQYIDTGYIPDYINGYKIECEVCPTELSNRYCILSGYNATNSISLEITQQDTARAYFLYDSNRALNKVLGTITSNKNTLIIEYLNGRFTHTLNGETSSETINLLDTANESMYMFVDRQLRYSTFYKPLKMYKCKLYNNNYLIRDFVPCYRNSDNEVGMYDLVNGVFYTNQGTGAFTYGNVVPNASIELCKIGTYQDRIYKNNGNWYLHKEIGKAVLNGSENWIYYTSASTSVFYIMPELFGIYYKQEANLSCYCDYYKGKGQVASFDNVYNLGNNVITFRTTFTRLVIRDDRFNNIEDFKAELSTNNTTLYYVLATPTDTQITDTTLVSQLNALYNATIYSTTHINTETSNLLPYINLKYNVVTASPSPDRASEVEVVTGNNTITISNEDGTKTQTYNLTLGNLELCKIGDYQDYFYKENGNWYKYGAIGKVVFDGSEEWSLPSSISGNITQFEYTSISIGKYLNNNTITAIANYFRGVGYTGNTDGNSWAIDKSIVIAYGGKIRIMNSLFTTATEFKDWLSTHNTTCYYVLATPMTTQITDQLLVSQLDELQKAMSYYDKTIITQTNADKPFILDVIAIRDLQDIFNL